MPVPRAPHLPPAERDADARRALYNYGCIRSGTYSWRRHMYVIHMYSYICMNTYVHIRGADNREFAAPGAGGERKGAPEERRAPGGEKRRGPRARIRSSVRSAAQ